MGGMISYLAMGVIADKIAAFAPISGYLLGGDSYQSSSYSHYSYTWN